MVQLATVDCSEEIHVLLPLWWDIGDLDVVLDGIDEVLDGLDNCVALWGVLEAIESSFDGFGLLVGESSTIGFFELGLPWGLSKLLVLVLDVIQFIGNGLDVIVVDLEALIVVVDSLVECSEDIFPLLSHSLTSWSTKELLLQLTSSLNFWRMSPSLKRRLDVSDWS